MGQMELQNWLQKATLLPEYQNLSHQQLPPFLHLDMCGIPHLKDHSLLSHQIVEHYPFWMNYRLVHFLDIFLLKKKQEITAKD